MIREAFRKETTSCTLDSGQTEKCKTGEEQTQEHTHHFFYIKGTVHKEFILAGQTVNSATV
jgi:hypothetical protein